MSFINIINVQFLIKNQNKILTSKFRDITTVLQKTMVTLNLLYIFFVAVTSLLRTANYDKTFFTANVIYFFYHTKIKMNVFYHTLNLRSKITI